jgi:hypothetical protein
MIYKFCSETRPGGFLTLRDGHQGRRMIEVYAIAGIAIGADAGA